MFQGHFQFTLFNSFHRYCDGRDADTESVTNANLYGITDCVTLYLKSQLYKQDWRTQFERPISISSIVQTVFFLV